MWKICCNFKKSLRKFQKYIRKAFQIFGNFCYKYSTCLKNFWRKFYCKMRKVCCNSKKNLRKFRKIFAKITRFSENSSINNRSLWRKFYLHMRKICLNFKTVQENFRKIFAKFLRFSENSIINIRQFWKFFEENFIEIWEKLAEISKRDEESF